MPFDAAVLSKPITLHDHLALLGITPVPMDTLIEHKKAQDRLYKAHWITKRWLPFALFGIQLAAFEFLVNAATTSGHFVPSVIGLVMAMLATIMWVGVIGAFLSLLNVKVYGKPEWVHFPAQSFHDFMVPAPIRDVVREVRRNLPGTLIIGELRRREVVLDPYVLFVRDGETVCLGIWIDQHVIACADRI